MNRVVSESAKLICGGQVVGMGKLESDGLANFRIDGLEYTRDDIVSVCVTDECVTVVGVSGYRTSASFSNRVVDGNEFCLNRLQCEVVLCDGDCSPVVQGVLGFGPERGSYRVGETWFWADAVERCTPWVVSDSGRIMHTGIVLTGWNETYGLRHPDWYVACDEYLTGMIGANVILVSEHGKYVAFGVLSTDSTGWSVGMHSFPTHAVWSISEDSLNRYAVVTLTEQFGTDIDGGPFTEWRNKAFDRVGRSVCFLTHNQIVEWACDMDDEERAFVGLVAGNVNEAIANSHVQARLVRVDRMQYKVQIRENRTGEWNGGLIVSDEDSRKWMMDMLFIYQAAFLNGIWDERAQVGTREKRDEIAYGLR